MSGRALIIVVTGVIIITSVILYNIGASSTNITANFNNYFLRQTSQNMAQTGANLALRQLGNSHTWRSGFSLLHLFGGRVSVSVTDVSFASITNAIRIQSVGIAELNSMLEHSDTSIVYCYFPPATFPSSIRGLITLNSANAVNGGITIDGRDHDLSGAVIADSGTYGIWTTGATFSLGGSSSVGGTALYVDYVPSGTYNPAVILTNQVFASGFPTSPDSAMGGVSEGYPEGTLKAIAKTGVAGSQYVTNPSLLHYPLKGITYVETAGSWSLSNISGAGILIVHNSSHNANITNTSGTFAGIMIADDMVHLHSSVYGAIIGLTTAPTGNVLGNGNAQIRFSRQAITNATSVLANGSQPKVIAWWE